MSHSKKFSPKYISNEIFAKYIEDYFNNLEKESDNEIKSNLCGTNIGILATVEQGKGEVLRILLPEDFKQTKIMDLKLPAKGIVGIVQRRNRIIIR